VAALYTIKFTIQKFYVLLRETIFVEFYTPTNALLV